MGKPSGSSVRMDECTPLSTDLRPVLDPTSSRSVIDLRDKFVCWLDQRTVFTELVGIKDDPKISFALIGQSLPFRIEASLLPRFGHNQPMPPFHLSFENFRDGTYLQAIEGEDIYEKINMIINP